MRNPSEIFRSVEDVWVLWAAAALALTALARGPRRAGGWRRLLESEDGAAYSLVYVMTFPIYMMLVCLVIQSTLILVVKMGTVYAAFAAARAAVVWGPAEPPMGLEKARLAAVGAMAPFASSSSSHAAGAGVSGASSPAARRYFEAYRRYSRGPATANYLISKYRFAERATEVSPGATPARPGDDLTVEMTYEMPLVIPGAGRILGHRAPWPAARFWTRRIASSATLTDETPAGPDQTLGIDYVSD